jgi:hypothetical protein
MIEKILKKSPRIFRYGEVVAVNSAQEKVQVQIGIKSLIWIKTPLSLEKGEAVIVARNNDSSWFVVQDSRKAMPTEGALVNV